MPEPWPSIRSTARWVSQNRDDATRRPACAAVAHDGKKVARRRRFLKRRRIRHGDA